ncbi:MAG: hypothetical protein FJX72_18510, partial [Armatimonadetes bacterium]|nr:hypothetical protein [Armatimonadota bacterium]
MIAAALALHGPAIVRGRVLLPADVVLLMRPWGQIAVQRFPELRYAQNQLLGPIFEYYPWRHYSRSRIRAGELPLWNPYEMGGNVLLANSQSAVLYPPNALLYVLPLWVGINLVTLFHTTTTGLLMLGLLRCMGLRPGAAVAGAFTWMLCGCLIVWTEFQTPTAALCWLPGALWAAEVFVRRWASYKADGAPKHRRGAIGALVLMAVALALALVAGHPQFAFYVVLAVAITMALRTPRAALWALPTTLVLAGSIGAATLIPVAEAARINHRGRDAGFAKSVKL